MSTNCCIYLGRDQHYYSVPYQHISKKAHVAYTLARENLRGRGTRRNAPRDHAKGKYTIVEEHLASNSSEYRGLSAGKYIERARKASRELAEVMTRIFYDSNMPAETHYRTCDGLLNLQRSSERWSSVRPAETALRHGRCNYRFIRSLVESKCAGVAQEGSLLSPPEHDNIRGREQFR